MIYHAMDDFGKIRTDLSGIVSRGQYAAVSDRGVEYTVVKNWRRG